MELLEGGSIGGWLLNSSSRADSIMHIIYITSVLWNGKRLQNFQPQRGLRQGDPLSPYLFVLCLEVLGQRTSRAVEEKEWQPIKASKGGPLVSHLFFANDLLLFGTASNQQAIDMEKILLRFCQISRQKVNNQKSSLWFSLNTRHHLQCSIRSGFHVPIKTNLGI